MSTVRFGVLGAADIALEKVIPAMQQGAHTRVTAIASRSLDTAQEAAGRLGIDKYYGSYEALLADPDVDAIYNPLPNHLHVPWSIRALEAGKHVLCEKPLALSSSEAQSLVEALERHGNLKLMEAFMYRHHPQWVAARRLVSEGQIGTLRTVQSFFSFFDDNPTRILNQPELGGGSLMDIGCYPISLSRFLFDAEPEDVMATVEFDPRFRVDRLASGILRFEGGTSTFTCGTQLSPYQRVNIFGTTGRIEIEIPFNAPPDRPCRMWHETEDGQKLQTHTFEVCDQYTIQGDLFARAVLEDSDVPTPIEDGVSNMQVIEAIFRSSMTGVWEEP
jgi:predicted dehydrogenase